MYTFGRLEINMKIVIINGPNLNLLGKREPEIYGSTTFESFLVEAKKQFPKIEFEYYFSNIEGELVNTIQKLGFDDCSIILNAAAYTHTSVAIADAVAAVTAPVIEVHISQPAAREKERHTSLLSKYCLGTISGLGLQSYTAAIEYFKHTNEK